jgi:hypothetical protein
MGIRTHNMESGSGSCLMRLSVFNADFIGQGGVPFTFQDHRARCLQEGPLPASWPYLKMRICCAPYVNLRSVQACSTESVLVISGTIADAE